MFFDDSKITNLLFAGFAIFDVNNDIVYCFRTTNKILIFSCEAMAIKMALRIVVESPFNKISIFFTQKA